MHINENYYISVLQTKNGKLHIYFFVYLFFLSFEKSNSRQWNNRYILAKKNRVKLFVFLITEPNDIHT